MLANHIYQIFKGKTIFCVVNYFFGTPEIAKSHPIEDYYRITRGIPPHARSLIAVNCSDTVVKSVVASTENAYHLINLQK